MLSLVYFLIILSVLVMVHEYGHFIVARRMGVRVEKFSFGFGPKIWSTKKGETEYLISLIPLGGYVKMAGDDPADTLTHQPWEYLSRPIRERFAIIAAGPVANYLLAFVIFSVIFMFGSPTMTTEVGGIMQGYPAATVDLRIGDTVKAIDGTPVKYWEDMTTLIHQHAATPLRLTVTRQEREFDVTLMPMVRQTKDIFGNEVKIALVGIMPSQKIVPVRYGFFESFGMGARKLWDLTAITYKALGAILTGRMPFKDSMTGPIGIFVITGKAAQMGAIYLFHFVGILSASLAIFNLLPFPVLDGGHILFLIIEKIRRRPLSLKAQEAIGNVGVTLLIIFTVFVFYSDVMKFGIFDKLLKVFKH